MSTLPQNFGECFLAEFADISAEDVEQNVAVLRRRALRALPGIPWQFIPTELCERRTIVGLRGLMLLCCCLDCVHEAGGCAAPGNVTAEVIRLAWKAGGYEDWLKRATLMQLRQQADREVLRRHPDLLMGAIGARLAGMRRA